MDPMEDPDDILRANRSREKTYMFDGAFDYSASQVGLQERQMLYLSCEDFEVYFLLPVQEEVYRATTKGLIEGLISGYNATVFAYGPTGQETTSQ